MKQQVEEWKDDLYDATEKFSPIEAERLRTLDRMQLFEFGGLVTIDHHRFTLRYVTETLGRLDRMLEKRFRPKMAP